MSQRRTLRPFPLFSHRGKKNSHTWGEWKETPQAGRYEHPHTHSRMCAHPYTHTHNKHVLTNLLLGDIKHYLIFRQKSKQKHFPRISTSLLFSPWTPLFKSAVRHDLHLVKIRPVLGLLMLCLIRFFNDRMIYWFSAILEMATLER